MMIAMATMINNRKNQKQTEKKEEESQNFGTLADKLDCILCSCVWYGLVWFFFDKIKPYNQSSSSIFFCVYTQQTNDEDGFSFKYKHTKHTNFQERQQRERKKKAYKIYERITEASKKKFVAK